VLEFFNQLAQNAVNAINQGNPSALGTLFFISALTEIGIPFPFILDTILIFTGYQHGLISKEVGLIMLSLLIGRLVGASAIYWLTRTVGKVFVNWLGRRFPFIQKKIAWLATKLQKRAPVAVAVTRLTPGLLTPSTVAAGVICIGYLSFCLGVLISSVIADGVLLIIGFSTARGVKYLGFAPSVWFIIVIGVIVAGAAWLLQRFFSRRSKQ
jgi:membrane protein DedA with SNARE-associated domain